MPTTVEFPFVEAVLHFPGGNSFHRPLAWMEFFALYPLGDDIRAALSGVINESESTTEVLLGYVQGSPEEDEVVVTCQAKAPLYPEMKLKFRFFALQSATGTWLAFVPQLGVIAVATRRSKLGPSVAEAIQMEFKRRDRWTSVPEMLAAQWSVDLSLNSRTVPLQCYTLADLREKHHNRELTILEEIAERMPEGEAVFGLVEPQRQLARSLQGRFGSSVLVVGPSGVGKTALLQATHGDCELWQVTATELLHRLMAASEGGGWEGALGRLCKALAKRKVWLNVGNLLEMFETGRYVGNNISLMEYMRSHIERGEVRVLAECTEDQLAVIEARCPGFVESLRRIRLVEPAPEIARMIIRKVSLRLARQYKILIRPEALDEAYRLHRRYAPYSGMPGQVIRFLMQLLRRVQRQEPRRSALERSDVIDAFCEYSGMPATFVDPGQQLDVQAVETFFANRIKGQQAARRVVVERILAVKSALARPGQPIATLLFAGPTGVGKTETAKALAEFMFSDPSLLIRFDMSEYSEPSAVLRLVGDSEGGAGLLTTRVRQQPFCVLLFDEIEKADPSFFDFLLQIAGEGRLTDSQGRVADFCGSLIIMTSNLGAADYGRAGTGFLANSPDEHETLHHFQEAVRSWFRPEMFNRIDEVVPFHTLDRSLMESLLELEMNRLAQRRGLQERGLAVEAGDSLIAELAERGHEPRFGARHLQRAVRDGLLVPLAGHIVSRKVQEPGCLAVDGGEGNAVEISFEAQGDDRAQRRQIAEQQEEITNWRRAMTAVIDGPLHVQALNHWDDLKRQLRKKERKRQESLLWGSSEWVREWETWRLLCVEGEGLLDTINALEDQVLAPGLGSRSVPRVDEQAHNDLIEWTQRMSSFCHRLFNTFNSDGQVATLGIFGAPTHLDLVANFYLKMAQQAFPNHVRAAWVVEGRRVRVGSESLSEKLITPRKAMGFLIEVKNGQDEPNALAYLECEEGVQSWYTVTDKTAEKFLIAIQPGKLQKFNLPHNIGRKSLFKNKLVRRTIRAWESSAIDPAYKEFWPLRPYSPEKINHVLRQLWQNHLQACLKGEKDA